MPTPLHYDLDWLHDNHTVVSEENLDEHVAEVDAKGLGRGLVPRDFQKSPPGCYAFAPSFPSSLLIDPSQYASRLADQQANKTSLFDVREANYDTLKSYDQNGYGLCWAFSSTKAATYLRVLAGLPSARLAPYYVAGEVKGWRDQGGSGDESLDFIASNGVPEESFCPDYSRRNETAAAAANASMNKITAWYDGSGSKEQMKAVMISACLLGLPWVGDYNRLSHSMAGCYLASLDPLVSVDDNSWRDINDYGPKGLYVMKGSLAVPDNIFVGVSIEASQT